MLLPPIPCVTDADRATLTIEQIEAKIAAAPVARINGREVTKTELDTAFKLIQPKDNWKNPIDIVIEADADTLGRVHDACVFFAGCAPTFQLVTAPVQGRAKYRVTAVGYYRAIGA